MYVNTGEDNDIIIKFIFIVINRLTIALFVQPIHRLSNFHSTILRYYVQCTYNKMLYFTTKKVLVIILDNDIIYYMTTRKKYSI